MSKSYLICRIEELREQMIHLAVEKGNISDREVLNLSEQLDVCLVQFQKMLNQKTTQEEANQISA